MKKGFTLIELLAVITLLAIVTIAIVPSIIKQVTNKKEEVNQTTLDLIYNAADLYASNDKATYKNEMGSVYCITLETLVKEDLLDKNVTNFKTGKSIPLNRIVKMTVNSYYEFEYELLDKDSECYQSTGTLLSDVVNVGDYVAYDAGTWTSSADNPTSQGNFGGYTNGLNKANSVSWCYGSSYTTTLKGWRVLSISGTTVTLVHAGHPECYYHASGYSDASVKALNNRAISEYENTKYAQENKAHVLTYDEALAVTGSISATINDLRYNGATGTNNNSSPYWLATAASTDIVYYVNVSGTISSANSNFSLGVRPVIVLKEGIKTTGKGTDILGQEAWLLLEP